MTTHPLTVSASTMSPPASPPDDARSRVAALIDEVRRVSADSDFMERLDTLMARDREILLRLGDS